MYAVALLKRGVLKRKVLSVLKTPKTATMLSLELKKHRASMSCILLALERRELVICRNPRDHMSRFYVITEKGEQALREVKRFV